jgi:phospholipase/carboxylesterase
MAIGRREFGALAGGAILSVTCGSACRAIGEVMAGLDGRLTARPPDHGTTTATGEHALGLAAPRDAVLRLPSPVPDGPMPFLLFLHGASGAGSRVIQRLGASPDDRGVAIAAPDSRDMSWDAIRADFGPDVRFIDRVLAAAFAKVAVDPARLAIGGFSDGATYALSLGLINGDLFRRVVAFSPGFVVDGPAHGRPTIFISHGRSDDILPIDDASRRIVPLLRARGCEVTFKEFDGGHEMPAPIVGEAMTWVAAPPR